MFAFKKQNFENYCHYGLKEMGMEVGHPEMWKEEKLYDSAVLLLGELHFMMICNKLPAKHLAL
jgi:hypothetical protein